MRFFRSHESLVVREHETSFPTYLSIPLIAFTSLALWALIYKVTSGVIMALR